MCQYVSSISWLERKSLVKTFDYKDKEEDPERDIQEIHELLDEDIRGTH